MTPEEKRAYNRANYAKRMEDPEFRAKKAAATARWKAENPDRARAARKTWRNSPRGRETRKKWERKQAPKLNALHREYYHTGEGRAKSRARGRRRIERRRDAEAAQLRRAVESARRLVDKAARLASEKQYGIDRKEAA